MPKDITANLNTIAMLSSLRFSETGKAELRPDAELPEILKNARPAKPRLAKRIFTGIFTLALSELGSLISQKWHAHCTSRDARRISRWMSLDPFDYRLPPEARTEIRKKYVDDNGWPLIPLQKCKNALKNMSLEDACEVLTKMPAQDARKLIESLIVDIENTDKTGASVLFGESREEALAMLKQTGAQGPEAAHHPMKPEAVALFLNGMQRQDASTLLKAMPPQKGAEMLMSYYLSTSNSGISNRNSAVALFNLCDRKAAGTLLRSIAMQAKAQKLTQDTSVRMMADFLRTSAFNKTGLAEEVLEGFVPETAEKIRNAMEFGSRHTEAEPEELESMPPDEAAQNLSFMSMNMAAAKLTTLEPEKAAQILNAMAPEKAAALLSSPYTTIKSDTDFFDTKTASKLFSLCNKEAAFKMLECITTPQKAKNGELDTLIVINKNYEKRPNFQIIDHILANFLPSLYNSDENKAKSFLFTSPNAAAVLDAVKLSVMDTENAVQKLAQDSQAGAEALELMDLDKAGELVQACLNSPSIAGKPGEVRAAKLLERCNAKTAANILHMFSVTDAARLLLLLPKKANNDNHSFSIDTRHENDDPRDLILLNMSPEFAGEVREKMNKIEGMKTGLAALLDDMIYDTEKAKQAGRLLNDSPLEGAKLLDDLGSFDETATVAMLSVMTQKNALTMLQAMDKATGGQLILAYFKGSADSKAIEENPACALLANCTPNAAAAMLSTLTLYSSASVAKLLEGMPLPAVLAICNQLSDESVNRLREAMSPEFKAQIPERRPIA